MNTVPIRLKVNSKPSYKSDLKEKYRGKYV